MPTGDEKLIGRYARSRKSGQIFKVVGTGSFSIFMESVERRSNPGYRETRKRQFDHFYEWVDE